MDMFASDEQPRAKRVVVRIKQPDFYKLCRYLEAERETILAKKPTKEKAAKQATKSLGFQVTRQHVIQAAETVGLEWTASVKNTNAAIAGHSTRHQLAITDAHVVALDKRQAADHAELGRQLTALRARFEELNLARGMDRAAIDALLHRVGELEGAIIGPAKG